MFQFEISPGAYEKAGSRNTEIDKKSIIKIFSLVNYQWCPSDSKLSSSCWWKWNRSQRQLHLKLINNWSASFGHWLGTGRSKLKNWWLANCKFEEFLPMCLQHSHQTWMKYFEIDKKIGIEANWDKLNDVASRDGDEPTAVWIVIGMLDWGFTGWDDCSIVSETYHIIALNWNFEYFFKVWSSLVMIKIRQTVGAIVTTPRQGTIANVSCRTWASILTRLGACLWKCRCWKQWNNNENQEMVIFCWCWIIQATNSKDHFLFYFLKKKKFYIKIPTDVLLK